LDLDDFLAEPTPEAVFAAPPDAALFDSLIETLRIL
jgi:hypothetical protein